ncbi:hypothetical protein HanRHA438_Chr11g0507011 [Helianthus annuus]|uniref:Uncharacterized protein n=1 Tax=Helianthus annuus TaxID=4232 RepID=A0A251RWY1_HELAN|nr:hypothetical protein HanXRQr2_Chr11g0494361 [Helianthus annuus]KAJ0517727.1 hypothetical protein HanHA89_Chr11g0429011 [Helianthus annuus]KAJ0638883.1 hypothetical protein HanHA300_Chr00c0026g0685901 [Helianthus annuus]KAJ0685744.1 hypothetical protein HanLR1_Chr11g0406511 [Helianthus annuus]KAJ0870986.1 hypothetical protein HanRHA438_Chr11g0507011 [Helianthus annuus]
MPKQPITNKWQVNGQKATPQTLLSSKTDPTKEGGVLKPVVDLKLDRFHQTCFIIGFGSGQNWFRFTNRFFCSPLHL